MKRKKRYLSWGDVEDLIDILHHNIIESDFKVHHIFGLPRGGLIPAVMLSHKMGIPLSTYMYLPNTLIIDDICDTGKTLNTTHPEPTTTTGVLHYKPHTSIIKPNFYACTFASDDWIQYPWESKEANPIQDYLN